MSAKESRKVTIRINAFDRKTEFIAMELHIAPVDVIELRRLAGFPDEFDHVVGGIELKPQHLPRIRQWIDEVLDLNRFEYI